MLGDPETSPEAAAAAFGRLFPGAPPGLELGERLLINLGGDRSQELAAAVLRESAAAPALALAADVALLVSSDPKLAKEYLQSALQIEDHPSLRARLARAEAAQGQLVAAVALLDEILARNPEEEKAGLLRGAWLERLAALETEPASPCPCQSGGSFADCCREAARRLRSRFSDREPLYRLREEVLRYALGRKDLLGAAGAAVDGWVEDGALAPEEVDWSGLTGGDPEAQGLRLAIEAAWSSPLGEDDDDERSVLLEFAADPATPPESARRAREWDGHATWGLWQLDEPGDPGCLVTNYLTGARLYGEIPLEQREGLPRWSILLGYFSPLDGIWRSGSAFYAATPAEGRSLAQFALAFVERVAHHERGERAAAAQWAGESAREIEMGAWVPGLMPLPSPLSGLVDTVCAVMFAGLVARLRRGRESVPEVANTDGDPLELIEAHLRLADPDSARQSLLAHPDFDREGKRLVWQGRAMTKGEHAQALAQLRGQGLHPPSDPTPGRYARGWLEFHATGARVEVNSRARLDRLLALLAELGHPAEVAAEKVTDVVGSLAQQRLWMPPGPPQPRPPAAQAAWLEALPDEPIPALDGLSPRQAAHDEKYRERLEVWLRDIEYETAGGGITGLRETLSRDVTPGSAMESLGNPS